MIYARRSGLLSYLVRPLCAAFILSGIFGMVWLRSNLVSVEYSISELDIRKREMLKETKTLMADKAALLSIQKIENLGGAGSGLTFPDRKKVVYVKGVKSGPQQAAFEGRRFISPEWKDY